MTPATLGEIANLGHEEKEAAREFAEDRWLGELARQSGDRWAFLQGIMWERKRAAADSLTQACANTIHPIDEAIEQAEEKLRGADENKGGPAAQKARRVCLYLLQDVRDNTPW